MFGREERSEEIGEEGESGATTSDELFLILSHSRKYWNTQTACMREMGIVCYTVGCGVRGDVETVYRFITNVSGKEITKKKKRV